MNTNLGRVTPMTYAIHVHSPDRVDGAMPLRRPAGEMS